VWGTGTSRAKGSIRKLSRIETSELAETSVDILGGKIREKGGFTPERVPVGTRRPERIYTSMLKEENARGITHGFREKKGTSKRVA